MIVANARFRGRPPTGVDVHAAEVMRLLDGVREVEPPARWRAGIPATVWEQVGFRRSSRRTPRVDGRAREVLWSPCNTGPVTRRPHVITVQDVGPLEHPGWYSRWYAARARWIDARAIDRAAVIAAGSEFSAGRIAAVIGVPEERIRVVGNGVRHEILDTVPLDAPPVDRPERPRIVALGSLTAWKGQDRLVRAFRRVGLDAELVVIGGTNDRVMAAAGSGTTNGPPGTSSHVASVDESRGSGPVVRFTGRLPLEQVIGVMRTASATVSLSRYEGFDLPPVEAAALGVPTVVSDIPVHHETLGGLPGVHFVGSDGELDDAIAAAVVGALAAPDPAEIRERHRWSDVAARYVAIFRDELGDPDVALRAVAGPGDGPSGPSSPSASSVRP